MNTTKPLKSVASPSRANLFQIEQEHIKGLESAVQKFKDKLEHLGLTDTNSFVCVEKALKVVNEYMTYLDHHNDLPAYTRISNTHKALQVHFVELEQTEETEILAFDAKKILKMQEAHQKLLCFVAGDHVIGILKKAGNELATAERALRALL